ncbi:MAG: alpha/beta hydrolase [Cytophagales bacterium]|nr:alpha/beta hydrolase [Rhizobacter sp.]
MSTQGRPKGEYRSAQHEGTPVSAPEPQPFYFGPEGAELFGWLHGPDAARRQGLGLLICNPFGFEEACAHRSLRHFAEAASAAGFPSLRFDMAGCGNSQGDEFEANAPTKWLRCVHNAIDTLKTAGGVSQVLVLGVRLGATLATLAASERDDVAGLIAIAPVVRGRTYIRELTMLGQTGSAPGERADGSLESAGFLMTRETAASVSQVDLRALTQAPAPRVLIVERDDVTGVSEWAPTLKQFELDVRVQRWPGYALMMEDPQRAVVPDAMVAGVMACINEWASQVKLAPVAAEPPQRTALRCKLPAPDGSAAQVLETPVHIDTGTATRLFGMLVTPEITDASASPRPAVLMLNSGAIHHIGPNRLWVRLARRWAARGMTVLRLDIAGIGDSPPRPDAQENVVYSPHATQDVAAALDYLRTQVGASECHLVGLCSGAYHSFKAAVAGQPVASATMINPLTYFWKKGTQLSDVKEYELDELIAKFRGKVFTREPWLKLLHGQLDVRLVAAVALRRVWGLLAPNLTEAARVLHFPLRHNLAGELESAVQRGIRLRFVFAARAPGFVLLRKQSGRAMKRLLERKSATIDFIADADHTFTRLEARERLVAVLDRLMQPATDGPHPQA